MKQNKNLWLLLAAFAVVSIAWVINFSAARTAEAKQAETVRKAKWEYCAIAGTSDIWNQVTGTTGATVTIVFYESSGRREEIIEYRPLGPVSSLQRHNFQREARALAIAKLGEEGWELVDIPVSGEKASEFTYLFKRPKP